MNSLPVYPLGGYKYIPLKKGAIPAKHFTEFHPAGDKRQPAALKSEQIDGFVAAFVVKMEL